MTTGKRLFLVLCPSEWNSQEHIHQIEKRHRLVFRKCWWMTGACPRECWKPVLKNEGRCTENRVLSVLLQTNFRSFLIWFACILVLFSIHCLLHHLIFHTICKGREVTEQGQRRGGVILYAVASTPFRNLTINFTIQVLPVNSSYSVWWSQ